MISRLQFWSVLIRSRNSEYPWIFTVLGQISKWLLVSRQFRKMKFLAVKEAAAPANTNSRKRQNLVCPCLLVGRKTFLTEFATKL